MLNELTIVIPTVGEDSLYKLIDKLNFDEGKKIKFIISPIREKYLIIKDKIKDNNVEVVFNKYDGQVTQRLNGFKCAQTKYVMQLDADCFINLLDLKKMINELNNLNKNQKNNCTLAPVFIDIINNQPIHKIKFSIKSFLSDLILGFPLGVKKMGKISLSGTNFGVDPSFMKSDLIETDWLPGGCILHLKNNLVMFDYYPFKGKAFCEDLIHSHFLKKKNKLFITKKAICKTSFPIFPKDKTNFRKFLDAFKFFTIDLENKNYIRYSIISLIYKLRFLINAYRNSR